MPRIGDGALGRIGWRLERSQWARLQVECALGKLPPTTCRDLDPSRLFIVQDRVAISRLLPPLYAIRPHRRDLPVLPGMDPDETRHEGATHCNAVRQRMARFHQHQPSTVVYLSIDIIRTSFGRRHCEVMPNAVTSHTTRGLHRCLFPRAFRSTQVPRQNGHYLIEHSLLLACSQQQGCHCVNGRISHQLLQCLIPFLAPERLILRQ